MNKEFNKQTWSLVGLAMMTVAFFLISRAGFLWSDDYAMGYGKLFNFQQVISNAKRFYFNWGGGFLSAACQYLFCGLLGNHKIWFDLMNTLWFVFFVFVCGSIIGGDKKDRSPIMLCFALLFWFLCPVPRETIFWMVGSIGYLWVTTLSFVFLWAFLRLHSGDSSLWGKILLFLFSVVSAASIIPCVSICGAFVVYYAFHIKKFRGNAVPLVVGFVIGSLILLSAPGNFVRASVLGEYFSFGEKVKAFVLHPLLELAKYKVFWLLVIGWLLMLWKRRDVAIAWLKSNSILVLSLGWSVVAFSIVFRPSFRALFFTEVVSMVLVLRLVLHPDCIKLLESNKVMHRFTEWMFRKRSGYLLGLLMVVFVIDAGFAIYETQKMSHENDRLLSDIIEAKGVAALDVVVSSHRMAYAPYFPKWSWPGVAYHLKLDSVCVYPYYCNDKQYRDSGFGNQVYVDYVGYINADHEGGSLNSTGVIFVRNPYADTLSKHATFTMAYDRPHKWYSTLKRELLDHGQIISPERVVTVEREQPDTSFLGCDYYFIWMKKENLENLKSVEIEIE